MNVDVNKLKSSYLNKMNELYNKEYYFIQQCNIPSRKLSLEQSILDAQLRIFLSENNNIIVDGVLTNFCERNRKTRIDLLETEVNDKPDVLIVNNTTKIVDDTWDSINW